MTCCQDINAKRERFGANSTVSESETINISVLHSGRGADPRNPLLGKHVVSENSQTEKDKAERGKAVLSFLFLRLGALDLVPCINLVFNRLLAYIGRASMPTNSNGILSGVSALP